MSEPVSNYRLEKLVLGELSAEESAELLENPEVARRVEALRLDDARILARYPLRPRVSERSARRRVPFSALRDFLIGRKGLVPAISFAAFMVVVGSVLLVRGGMPMDDGTRLKGNAASLYLYRKTAAEAVELRNGAPAKRGDAIQAAYSVSERMYGFIFSLDGNGQLTAHLPETGAAAAELSRGELKVLDSSYILDEAPDFEIFFLVFSRRPFDLEQVRKTALGMRMDANFASSLGKCLGSSFGVVSIKLVKE